MLNKNKILAKHVALPILSILMIAGNSLLIYVTLRHKHLRTVTAYFIASLALTDLMMGCIVVPLMVAAEVGAFGHSPTVCLTVFCLAISEVSNLSEIILNGHFEYRASPKIHSGILYDNAIVDQEKKS